MIDPLPKLLICAIAASMALFFSFLSLRSLSLHLAFVWHRHSFSLSWTVNEVRDLKLGLMLQSGSSSSTGQWMPGWHASPCC